MKRVVAVGFAVWLVVASAVAVAGPGGQPGGEFAEPPSNFDRVQFVVLVRDDGSARWTFHFERQLDNESERRQFEAFAARFDENGTALYRNYRTRARGLVATGANVTGRGMVARNFTRDAAVRTGLTDTGVVEISFTWTAFAAREGDRVVVGDVFEGGFRIPEDVWLVVRTGDDLAFATVSPAPDSRSDPSLTESDSITYRGERTFTDEHPRVTFVPASSVPPDTGTPGPDGGSQGGLLLAVAAVVALLGVGAVVAWRRGGPVVGGSGGTAAGAAREPAVPDEELLTDDDRVLKLLRENGGRMKQVNIVEETGWSKSKVSMLLSEMEEEGRINKLRVGRENIISLQGSEPDAAGSPHE